MADAFFARFLWKEAVQLGLSMQDLELLTVGMISDMYVESRNDDYNYPVLATQNDMD